jgi:uncharacterized protein (DUF2336 family)
MIVHHFLRWLETAPANRRAEAAGALARAFLFSDVHPEERRGMEQAMTLLLDDASPEVRFALADALANHPEAPGHVVMALANDQPDISRMVLARSSVLLDAELVDFVAVGNEDAQAAIASRLSLGAPVAAAICEVAGPGACRRLAENAEAAIPQSGLRRLAERFGDDVELRRLLLDRDDLPADARHLLVRRLGEALGNLVSVKAWMEPARARQVTADACDRATVEIAARYHPAELAGLVEHLRATRRLTTTLLLRALCAGNLPFFEAAVAVLADMPEGRVARLVRGHRGGMRAVCRKAGLPMRAFDAFDAAIAACREQEWEGPVGGKAELELALAERVLALYEPQDKDAAADLLALLRRISAEAARSAAREFKRREVMAA